MLADRKFKAIKIGLMRSKEFGLLRGVAMHGKTLSWRMSGYTRQVCTSLLTGG